MAPPLDELPELLLDELELLLDELVLLLDELVLLLDELALDELDELLLPPEEDGPPPQAIRDKINVINDK
jgi:hypothetical protein